VRLCGCSQKKDAPDLWPGRGRFRTKGTNADTEAFFSLGYDTSSSRLLTSKILANKQVESRLDSDPRPEAEAKCHRIRICTISRIRTTCMRGHQHTRSEATQHAATSVSPAMLCITRLSRLLMSCRVGLQASSRKNRSRPNRARAGEPGT